jgi:hypothetical protein
VLPHLLPPPLLCIVRGQSTVKWNYNHTIIAPVIVCSAVAVVIC